MTNKIWDGSTWKDYKNLKVWDGSNWKDALKGWLWNGSNWRQFYPEYPVNTSSPTISGSSTQGNVLTVTDGSWKGFPNDKAFSYTQTAYQWLRNGSNISGATGNQYATVLADVGNSISCTVTVSNGRGPTPATSSNSITIVSAIPGVPSALVLTDSTDTPPTPGAISVSNITTSSFNFSFGAASGSFTAYEVLTSNSNHVVSSLNQSTRTGTITGGSANESFYCAAFTTNTNCKVTASWSAGSNATSYDVYVGGVYRGNTSSTSFTYTTGAIGTYNVRVYSRNAAGAESTGVSGNVTLNKRYSSGGQGASGNFAGIIPSFNSGPSVSNLTGTSATISWTSTNQASYSISGVGNYSGSTGTSVNISGLNPGSSYTAYVTITSSTGNSVQSSVSFTAPIIPVINSFSKSTSDTAQTLISTSWSATNQSTWSISVSPATGGASGGSYFSGTNQTAKYIGAGSAGTTYSITLTITSTTGNTAQSTIYHTVPSGVSAPSTPGTPTLTYVSANNTSTTWGYSATWGSSSGSGTIRYQIDGLGGSGDTATLGLYSTNSASFNLSRNSSLWQIRVRATNNSGSSWSEYSSYSNSA